MVAGARNQNSLKVRSEMLLAEQQHCQFADTLHEIGQKKHLFVILSAISLFNHGRIIIIKYNQDNCKNRQSISNWLSMMQCHWCHKDTPPHCGCRQPRFWACWLWSSWWTHPVTAHRGRLNPQQRPSVTLLLSGHSEPGAPETRGEEATWEERVTETHSTGFQIASEYHLNDGIWKRNLVRL